MMTPYDEDPPQEALPRRAEAELGLTHAVARRYGSSWIVSGFKDGLRLYEWSSDGKKWKWRELTVGREAVT